MPDSPTYVPGTRIRRLEVLHDRLWMESPVTVVSDDGPDGVLAVLLEPGSPFTFHEHPIGPHPWSAHDAWGGTVVLQLHRAGDRYGVWKFFGTDGRFRHWYLNFEAPIVRHEGAFATDDHGLDLLVHPDGRREWKDVDHLALQVEEGRITWDTAARVLEEAAEVVRLLDADDRWWARWDDWTPTPPSARENG